MKKIAIILIMMLTFNMCSKEPNNNDNILSIEDLLVKNNEISGWTYSGSSWVANNISELTQYINGGAEIYQRHGFVEAAHQEYQGKIDNIDRQLRITIYNQDNKDNARATFEDPNLALFGGIQWEGGAGESAFYARYSAGNSQAIIFYRDKYFVSLEMLYDTDESLNILKQFALNVDGNMD